jgi:hypothetical protein
MLGSNGTSAGDIRTRLPRYFLHTTPEGEWCIRDSHTWDWDFVFIHTDREVCEKVLRLFNEG